MAVVWRQRLARLTEAELLSHPNLDAGDRASPVGRNRRRRPEGGAVERRDSLRAPGLDGELDIRDTQGQVAPLRAGSVAAQAVPPGTRDRDVLVLDGVIEPGARELVAHAAEPGLQGLEIGHDRSEERRVGKECRSRWSPDHLKKKKTI